MAPLANGPLKNSEGMLVFEVDLQKQPGSRLGIDVVFVSAPHGCGLVIERVNAGGLVEAWNRRNREPMRIRPGDFIIRVNNVEGDISALASELRSGAEARITVQRSSSDDAVQTLPASIMRQRPNSGGGVIPPGPAPMDMANSGPVNFTGPVGLPGHQNAAPMAKGMRSGAWGSTGYQHVGVPNQTQNADRSQQWPSSRWWPKGGTDVSKLDVDNSRMPPPSRLAIAATPASVGPSSAEVVRSSEHGVPEPSGALAIAEGAGACLSENSFTFQVSLTKPDRARLGIDVMPHTVTEFCGLTVKRVSKGGVVDEWNQRCRDPRAQVCPGDRIVKVNGVTCDFAHMWEELCTRRDLNVTVMRCTSQIASCQAGPQSSGVDPIALPRNTNRSMAMLENPRRPPAVMDVSLPSGGGGSSQVGHAPPAISLPNQQSAVSIIALGRDGGKGSQSSGPVTSNLGYPSGHDFGDGEEMRHQPMVPLHGSLPLGPGNNTLIAGPGAAGLGQDVLRFDVVLETSKNRRVGMDVILVSGNQICGFVVERITEGGRVDLWNKTSQPPRRVQTGDYIVQVNGVGNWQSLSKMAEEFAKENRQVCFTIQRGPQGLLHHQGIRKHLQLEAERQAVKETKRQEAADYRAALKAAGVPPGLPPMVMNSFANHVAFDEDGGCHQQTDEQNLSDGHLPPPTGLGKLVPPPPPPLRSGQFGLQQTIPEPIFAPSTPPQPWLLCPKPGAGAFAPAAPPQPKGFSLANHMPEPSTIPAWRAAVADDRDISMFKTKAECSPPPGLPPMPEALVALVDVNENDTEAKLGAETTLESKNIETPDNELNEAAEGTVESQRVLSTDHQTPSSADRVLETDPVMMVGRRRTSRSTITPIGAGRDIGRAHDQSPSSEEHSGDALEGPTAAPDDERKAPSLGPDNSPSAEGPQQVPATLLVKTLQLNDEELSSLLRYILARKPWLRVPVVTALGSQ